MYVLEVPSCDRKRTEYYVSSDGFWDIMTDIRVCAKVSGAFKVKTLEDAEELKWHVDAFLKRKNKSFVSKIVPFWEEECNG